MIYALHVLMLYAQINHRIYVNNDREEVESQLETAPVAGGDDTAEERVSGELIVSI